MRGTDAPGAVVRVNPRTILVSLDTGEKVRASATLVRSAASAPFTRTTFRRGSMVGVVLRDGSRPTGIVARVNASTLSIDLDDGRKLAAHPRIVTLLVY